MLEGIPLRAPSIQRPQNNETSEASTSGTCEQLACLLTISPAYIELNQPCALFAFPLTSEDLVFPVRYHATDSVEEYCMCAVVNAVENLKIPGMLSRVVTAGDVRAHFIVVPTTSDISKYAAMYPDKRIITAGHIFNLKPVAVDKIDDIFKHVIVNDSDGEVKVNQAVAVVQRLRKNPDNHVNCSTRTKPLFAISDLVQPLTGVETVSRNLTNAVGQSQHGDWSVLKDQVYAVKVKVPRRSNRIQSSKKTEP